jgi:cytochrome bd-type quinol oxidase subunit 2
MTSQHIIVLVLFYLTLLVVFLLLARLVNRRFASTIPGWLVWVLCLLAYVPLIFTLDQVMEDLTRNLLLASLSVVLSVFCVAGARHKARQQKWYWLPVILSILIGTAATGLAGVSLLMKLWIASGART